MSITYGRYTKRGLLEYIAERTDRLLSTTERVLTMTTEESTAVTDLIAEVKQVGADLGTLVMDAKSALAAKDNIIQQQANQIAALQQQAGVNVATIASDEASIQQQKDAANAASAELVARLSEASSTLKDLDTSIVSEDTPFRPAPTAVQPTPPAAIPTETVPPANGAPVSDGSTPTDTSTGV